MAKLLNVQPLGGCSPDLCVCLRAARTLSLALAEEPHVNPATGTREFALWDPDGYYVMVSALA